MTTSPHPDLLAPIRFATPSLPSLPHVRLVRASDDLWRVLQEQGHVIGHLQIVTHPLGLRYRACRFHRPTARLRALGDFWSAEDAVRCLRTA